MSTRAIDAVIFDLGGVIMRNGSPRDFTQQYPDHDPAHIAELIMGPHHLDTDHPWHQVERGQITLAQCREMTQQLLSNAGVTRPASPPKESSSTRSSFAFELNDDMVAFIHDLRSAQIPTAILTNNVREFRQWWWPLLNFDELFTTIVDSHEVGMRKPNPAIYQLTLDRLGVEATRAAFLDDLYANVVAASAVGLHVIHVEQDSLPAIQQARTLAGLN
jgi:epoxide hydrolase-like predicted phosphatase